MEIITSWQRQGREEGLQEGLSQGISEGISQGVLRGIAQGKETLVLRQLQRRLGVMSAAITARLDELSPDQLDDLGEALLDFGSISDLEQWLTLH